MQNFLTFTLSFCTFIFAFYIALFTTNKNNDGIILPPRTI